MLTFEKIRDLERGERESRKMQKLPENFFNELRDYMHRKQKMNKASDILELENVKNTIKRLFELRERKLVELALSSLRTGLPVENLTKREEEIFSTIVEMLKNFEKEIFDELSKPVEEKKEILFKVKKTLPQFIGPDMKSYELKENDIVSLPKPLSDLLLKEGVIEEIKS